MHLVQNTWYVKVDDQAYGPYNSEQMQGFCTEGRVNEYSMISQAAHDGYAAAAQFQSFLQWTGALQAEAPIHIHQAARTAQVLHPISTPQTGVLARQIAPARYAPQAVAATSVPLQHQVQSPVQHLSQNSIQYPLTQAEEKTVFVVMAEIRSENGMRFLQALQAQGTAQRIGDSVWLLRSKTSVEQLRNALSQTLTGDDRLFLLDSFANKTAWFNIGTNMDSKIRELWDLSTET